MAWLLTPHKLLKTENGGVTWIEQPQPLPSYPVGDVRTIEFLTDGKSGWVAGGIYRPVTENEKRFGLPRNISDPPSNTVLKPAVVHTEDGGKTWLRQSIPDNTGRIYALTFLNDQEGFALESSGPFYTRDGGKVWRRSDFRRSCTDQKYLEGYDSPPIQVFFLDSRNAWLSFEDGRIAKSTDGGASWCDLLAPNALKSDYYEKYFKKIHFIDRLSGFGLAADGLLYETKDGGKTWIVNVNIRSDDAFFFQTKCWLISRQGLFEVHLR